MRTLLTLIPCLLLGCTSGDDATSDSAVGRGLACRSYCSDADCSVFGQCRSADELRSVTIHWTAWGDPVDVYACGARKVMDLGLRTSYARVDWDAVACTDGSLEVEHVPTGAVDVRVGASFFSVPDDGDVWFDLTELP